MAQLVLITPRYEIESAIAAEAATVMNRALAAAGGDIRRRVGELVVKAISQSPAVGSLIHGELREQLGVVNAEQTTSFLAQQLAIHVEIEEASVIARGSKVTGGLTIKIFNGGDLRTISNNPIFAYPTENSFRVPWLEWLLYGGGTPLVYGYAISYGNPEYSRTGSAIMRKTNNANWTVPANFAGTEGANFVTQALEPLEKEVDAIIQEELQRRL